MAEQNFDTWLEHEFKVEGGFVQHKRDPGGATNMGITHKTLAHFRGVASVSVQAVRNLDKREAGQIYRRNYWNKVWGDELRSGVDIVTADAGVNSGVSRGVKWLQRALGFKGKGLDGGMGPITRDATNAHPDPVALIKRCCAIRFGFLRSLSIWEVFGTGWTRRVNSTEALAVSLAVSNPLPVLSSEGRRAKKTAVNQGTAATGTGGAGAGTTQIDGLPLDPAVIWATVAALAIVALVLAVRSRRNAGRATAYAERARIVAAAAP